MKKYETADLRDVVLVGHGKSGKTSLTEAILFDVTVIELSDIVKSEIERR